VAWQAREWAWYVARRSARRRGGACSFSSGRDAPAAQRGRKRRSEYTQQLAGAAQLIIVADNDEPGVAHAAEVAANVGSAGIPHRLVAPAIGKDAYDHLAAGRTLEQLVPVEATGEKVPAALRFVSLQEFIDVDEDGASALLGDDENVLIPEGGDVMFYGDGGVGKTTMNVDLAFHLAAGDPWLAVPTVRPLRVGIIENEGPRPLFRAKLRRKSAAWSGLPLEDRIVLLEEPWAQASLDDPDMRVALADAIRELELDVVMIGPVTRSGMNEAGTLPQIRDYMDLVGEVRSASGRRVTFVLVHHENKGGDVSGAWEGAVDTLFHVQAQGNGRTRLFVQKARWSAKHHKQTFALLWSDGEGFTIEDKPGVTAETMAEELRAVVREIPGGSWTKIRARITGNAGEAAVVRDRLLADGEIVNIPTRAGHFNLWAADDPAATRSDAGTGLERHLFPTPDGAPDPSRSPVPNVSRNGERNGTGEPGSHDAEDELERDLVENLDAELVDLEDRPLDMDFPTPTDQEAA
jgi:hypothetical protein